MLNFCHNRVMTEIHKPWKNSGSGPCLKKHISLHRRSKLKKCWHTSSLELRWKQSCGGWMDGCIYSKLWWSVLNSNLMPGCLHFCELFPPQIMTRSFHGELGINCQNVNHNPKPNPKNLMLISTDVVPVKIIWQRGSIMSLQYLNGCWTDHGHSWCPEDESLWFDPIIF